MDIELRQYQQEALNTILGAIPHQSEILIQAATGAGKTIIFCKLIETILTKWPQVKIGILAHRKELITQAQDKLLRVWPDAPIGLACASTGEPVDLDKPVVIGSVQTLVRRIKATDPFDLIIVDETHRIPPTNINSQYKTWLDAMQAANEKVRILGFTATPFRLSHGYIYGWECKVGNVNLFPQLDYRISISQLQELDYLCQYRAKEITDVKKDLVGVRVTGEYNLGDLSDVMSREEHVGSAVKAVKEYAPDRSRIVVFCVTIDHAETVMRAFQDEKFRAACVHSKMPMAQRNMILKMFERGELQVVCNVGVLTEGWDSPAVDCIVLCRPTKSVGLYVQMVGRGLRPHRDKKDVLILDLSSNCKTHGDPNSPEVEVPGPNAGVNKLKELFKVCHNCKELNSLSALFCVACRMEFPKKTREKEQINDAITMTDVVFNKPKKPAPFVVEISEQNISDFISKKGNRMLRVNLVGFAPGSFITQFVNVFFDFEGNASEWSQKKARQQWRFLVQTEPPESMEEALERQGELAMSIPRQIEVVQNGRWMNVHSWKVNPWNEDKEADGDFIDYDKNLKYPNNNKIPF